MIRYMLPMSDLISKLESVRPCPLAFFGITNKRLMSGIKKDTGMPPKWQQVLDDNGITQDEQERNPNGVMAVVQYLKHQDEGEDEEEEVWAKMKNAQAPALPISSAMSSQPTTPGGAGSMASKEMSREPSNDSPIAGGAMVGDFTSPRMAPVPPTKPSLNRMLVCFLLYT